jgi:hypothetical protein
MVSLQPAAVAVVSAQSLMSVTLSRLVTPVEYVASACDTRKGRSCGAHRIEFDLCNAHHPSISLLLTSQVASSQLVKTSAL